MSTSYLVFSPGIMGSALFLPSTGLQRRCVWTDDIKVVATTLLVEPWLLQGTTLLDVGDILRGNSFGYASLLAFLKSSGFIENTNFSVFPYDWRLPSLWNGRQLARKLAAIHATRPTEKFVLLGHSMGCLVNRAAAVTGAPNVLKLIELAPPHRGSSRAFRQLHQFPNVHPLVDAIRNWGWVPFAQGIDEGYSVIMRSIAGVWDLNPPDDDKILLGPPDVAALEWPGWSENATVHGIVPRNRYALWKKILSGSMACPPAALAFGTQFFTEDEYPYTSTTPFSVDLDAPTYSDGDGTVSVASTQWLPCGSRFSTVVDHGGIHSSPTVQSWVVSQIP